MSEGIALAYLGSVRRAVRSVAVGAALAAGVMVGGVALPSAASASVVSVVYGWGNNSAGQAGSGPVGGSQLRPVPVSGMATNVAQLAGGADFNVSLRSDGTVWAWGNNSSGQLGDGTNQNSFVPVQVHGLPAGIVQVTAGLNHAGAVASDGSVWTWGDNSHGELGYTTPGGSPASTPARVPGVLNVKQISAGSSFTVALRANGEVWTWGRGDRGQLGDGTHTSHTAPARNLAVYGMTQVSAGGGYALALRPGSVWAWGANDMSQLGNGSTVADSAVPVIVDRRTQNAVKIVAGAEHAFAVDPDGSLWAWGDNTSGALGIGVIDSPNGPFGHGRNVPTHLSLTGVTQLAAGADESVALRSDGTLLAWGNDLFGLLGDGTRNNGNDASPTPVTAVTGVTGLAIGGNTLLVLASARVMPNVVGLVRVTAVAELNELGLIVHVSFVPDPNPQCDNVGFVASQFPQAGALVQAGQDAFIRVYGPPPGGCP
jgi:alpha-tubulin suppressor-like RCC1 family protein